MVRREPGKKSPAKQKQVAPPPEAVGSDPPKGKKGRPKPKKKSNAKDPVPKSAEIIDDSDEEGGTLALPPPLRPFRSESPLSDLPEPGPSKPVTPSSVRKRLVPEVVITTVPRKRTSSPFVREVDVEGGIDGDGVNGSPRGKKRQKKAVEEDDFSSFDDEVEVAPKKGSKGKGKAPLKAKGRKKPQPKEAVNDKEADEDFANDATGTSRKAMSKGKTKATTKTKSARSAKSRVVDSDDEVTVDTNTRDSGVLLVDEAGGPSMVQQKAKGDETPPPQDARVSSNVAIGSSVVSSCNLQEDQENTPPPPKPAKSKSNPAITPSRKTPAPSSASSFVRLNYGHSLTNEEKPMTMDQIIRKANSATGTPSGTKSYSPFMKASRSVLKKIAPLHARRKTPPPLPPKPPPPKKTKKQLELEEKWEEELEETIEGWAALSSQERELLRRQKRDMEMGYED